MPSLASLARELLAQAEKLDAFLEQNGEASPSFEIDTLARLPEKAQDLRRHFADTSHVLQRLARGARQSGLDMAFGWTEQLILRIICHYKLASAVPLDGSASYEELAAASHLSQSLVSRTVRAAIPLSIFHEPEPGRVCHSAISRLLATDEGYACVISLQAQDIGPASASLVRLWDSLGGNAGAEPGHSAWSLSHGGKALFTTLSEEPEVAHRFNFAMKYVIQDKGFDMFDVFKAFDWHSLDRSGARVVDLGGGFGQVAQVLAQHTQHIVFTVQDLPHVAEEGRAKLPPELQGRISFEAGDFLQPQRAESPPNAFLISRCLHNWSDDYASGILHALVPALRQGSRVLIWDVVLKDEPVTMWSERFNLQEDLIMATISNGKNRSLAQFRQVLKVAHENFEIGRLWRKEGCKLSMIEVIWNTKS